MNPLILNFRGNALAQLARYDEAVEDYEEATRIFDADREAARRAASGGAQVRQASLSRANTGLALFGAGREPEAQLIMEKAGRPRALGPCVGRGGAERSGRHGRARGPGGVVLGQRPGAGGGVAVDLCV